MRYDLVVFDFDGTVADTLPSSLVLFNELADRYGFRRIDDPQAARNLTHRQFLKTHRISLLRLPSLTREFLDRQLTYINQVPFCSGFADILPELSRHATLGIVSSNRRENIARFLEAHGQTDRFAFVEGTSNLFGKGRTLRLLARKRQVDCRRVLYVGDEVRDVEAGRRANMDVAAVTWGAHLEAMLRAEKPTFLLHQPSELLDLLTSAVGV